MDSCWTEITNYLMWSDVSPEVRRLIRAVRKESLLEHDREETRPIYYSELERITDIFYEHIEEGRTYLMEGIKPKEIYAVTQEMLGALNLESVRKPIKLTTPAEARGARTETRAEPKKGVITVGRAWQILLYNIYTPARRLFGYEDNLVEGINEGLEGKKKGLLKTGDTIEINSGLPGGFAKFKVEIAKDTEEFAADFFEKDLRLEMDPKDVKKIFGKKDAGGKPIGDLGNDPGWFKYRIRKIRAIPGDAGTAGDHRVGH